MLRTAIIPLFLFLFLFLLPAFALAHGSGLSIELTKEGYLIDVGHSAEFIEGDTIRFDLELFKDVTKESVGFKRAWVRVNQGAKVIFSGSVSDTVFGKPGFSLALQEPGPYTLFVRFEKEEDPIIEADLSFIVAEGRERDASWPYYALAVLLGTALGVVGGLIIKK